MLVIASSIWLFWFDVNMSVESSPKIDKDEQKVIAVTVYKDSLTYPNLKNSLRRIFQAPFDLTYYNLCIENRSRATENGEVQFLDATVSLTDIEGKSISRVPLNLKANKKTCFLLNLDNMVLKNATLSAYQLKYFPTSIKFDTDPVVSTVAVPVFWDKFTSTIIFYVSMLGLVSLINSIFAILRDFFEVKKK